MGTWPVWVSFSGLNLYALSARMVLISRFSWCTSPSNISAKDFLGCVPSVAGFALGGPLRLSFRVPRGGGCASLKNCSCGRSLRDPASSPFFLVFMSNSWLDITATRSTTLPFTIRYFVSSLLDILLCAKFLQALNELEMSGRYSGTPWGDF